MSNISSNSLFHFTPKIEYLSSILENGFYPRISMESVKLSTEKRREGMGQTIPMVCFCDISLSQISEHITKFGRFGIGMTKSWGIKNKLNPIIYLNTNSKLSNSFVQLVDSVSELLGEHCSKHSKDISDEVMSISKFLKQNVGPNTKNPEKEIKFYDEREWRYVPEMSFDKAIEFSLDVDQYKTRKKVDECNKKLINYKLDFEVNDVKYIFLSNDKDIHFLISELRKSQRFNKNEIEILTTKILTVQQINEDF